MKNKFLIASISLIFLITVYYLLNVKKIIGFHYLNNYVTETVKIDSLYILSSNKFPQQVKSSEVKPVEIVETQNIDKTFEVGKTYYVNASEENNIHFYKTPNQNDMKASYFTSKELVVIEKIENGFAYVVFENDKKQKSKGWIKLNEMLLN